MRCKMYVGVTCVDGTCPFALQEEFEQYSLPFDFSCENWFYYKGCEDCALSSTEYCPKEH